MMSASLSLSAQRLVRQDSFVVKLRPGQSFSPFSSLRVDQSADFDSPFGTLGELRHLLRTADSADVKRFVRTNHWPLQYKLRAELWKVICLEGCTQQTAYRQLYTDAVKQYLGLTNDSTGFHLATDEEEKTVVLMHQQSLRANNINYRLNAVGRLAVRRLVAIFANLRPGFTYIPELYPLASLFLHYMSETDAFVCLFALTDAHHSQKYLIETELAATAAKLTLIKLLKRHLRRIYRFFQESTGLKSDLEMILILDSWRSWIFADLPLFTLVRVVDCFLFEGQKVLFRVCLALLHGWFKRNSKKFHMKGTDPIPYQSLVDDISAYCRDPQVTHAAPLLKSAFRVRNLKWSVIRKLQERNVAVTRQGSLPTCVSDANFFRITSLNLLAMQFRFKSAILSDTQNDLIRTWLPLRIQLLRSVKLFAVSESGCSFTTLWTCAGDAEETLIVIRTTGNNEVFGCYCASAWNERRKSSELSFFGRGETFLFRLEPGVPVKYDWVGKKSPTVGHHQELFMCAGPTTLIVGGGSGEAIAIRNELVSGTTAKCDTFDNEPLAANHNFEISELEVFGFDHDGD